MQMKAVRVGRLVGVFAAVLALLVSSTTSAAAAGPVHNIGWLHHIDMFGDYDASAYFDGDANGAPGKERIAVVLQTFSGYNGYALATVRGLGNIASCEDHTHGYGRITCTGNYFVEGTPVTMRVCWVPRGGGPQCTSWRQGRA